jgi:MFS family permease
MMVLAFLLAGLVFSGLVRPWHILVLAFLSGSANAFEIPARHSLVAELVPREDMTNAIALNVTLFNIGMIAGPAIAGVVYTFAGAAWCFTINGISFLAVIAALASMRIAPRWTPARQSTALAALRQGLDYFRGLPLARKLALSAFTYNIFDYAMVIFIPAFAVSLLGGDAATNGLLLAASGAGAVIGGLSLAALPRRVGRGKIWAISVAAAPLAIAAFAITRWLPLSLLLTGLIGMTSITVLSNTNTMLQSIVPDEMRGRVMSLYALLLTSGGPLGALALGALADRSSTMVLALTCAGMALAFAGWAWTKAREIREIV